MNYARLVLFTLGPGTRAKFEEMADEFFPKMRARSGFKNVTFIVDEEIGEYGALVHWESKEDADAAAAALEPRLREILADIVTKPPFIKQFEVYESKA